MGNAFRDNNFFDSKEDRMIMQRRDFQITNLMGAPPMSNAEIFLRFPSPHLEVVFLARPQRFLAKMQFDGVREEAVYCANPGSMKGLLVSGNRAIPCIRLPPLDLCVTSGTHSISAQVEPAFADSKLL